jgi:hypothetical protein
MGTGETSVELIQVNTVETGENEVIHEIRRLF